MAQQQTRQGLNRGKKKRDRPPGPFLSVNEVAVSRYLRYRINKNDENPFFFFATAGESTPHIWQSLPNSLLLDFAEETNRE